jgi:exonuclease I
LQQIIEELLPKRDVYIYGKRYLFKWPENNSELDGLEKQRLIEYLNSIGVNWAKEEANITNSSQILRVSPTSGVHHVNLFLRKDKGD